MGITIQPLRRHYRWLDDKSASRLRRHRLAWWTPSSFFYFVKADERMIHMKLGAKTEPASPDGRRWLNKTV